MRHLPRVLLLACAIMAACALSWAAGGASGVTLKSSLDSTWLLMGRTTPLHIELTLPKGATGYLDAPADTLCQGVEIASRTTPDTTRLSDGRLRISQSLVLQAFDSGLYQLPPVRFVAQGDTVFSNHLGLKVMPCNIDTLTDIHDYAPMAEIPRHFWDWLPDWWGWVAAALLLVCGAVAAYLLWWRKRPAGAPVITLPKRKAPEPWDAALQALEELKAEQLCEKGQEKAFYTRLTDILRSYIEQRFRINAVEMTSEQILQALQADEATRLPEKYMRQILSVADYVKFARHRPFSDDNARAYADAVAFVRDTRPAPPTAPAAPAAPTDNP